MSVLQEHPLCGCQPNYGYNAGGDLTTSVGSDYVSQTLMPVNIGAGVVLVLVEVAAIYLFIKKCKAAKIAETA